MPTCPNCHHSFEEQTPSALSVGNLWDNFVAMIDDVHAHVLSTQRAVLLSDDPRARRFGYEDPVTGRLWRIPLTAAKNSLVPPRDERMQAWAILVRTSEGRLQLANMVLPS